MFNPYVKAILALLAAFAGSIATGYDDSILTTSEIVVSVSAGFIAGTGTWAFASAWAKSLVAAGTAGLAQLAVAVQDEMISAQEWTTLAVATLGALTAVYSIPNTAASNKP